MDNHVGYSEVCLEFERVLYDHMIYSHFLDDGSDSSPATQKENLNAIGKNSGPPAENGIKPTQVTTIKDVACLDPDSLFAGINTKMKKLHRFCYDHFCVRTPHNLTLSYKKLVPSAGPSKQNKRKKKKKTLQCKEPTEEELINAAVAATMRQAVESVKDFPIQNAASDEEEESKKSPPVILADPPKAPIRGKKKRVSDEKPHEDAKEAESPQQPEPKALPEVSFRIEDATREYAELQEIIRQKYAPFAGAPPAKKSHRKKPKKKPVPADPKPDIESSNRTALALASATEIVSSFLRDLIDKLPLPSPPIKPEAKIPMSIPIQRSSPTKYISAVSHNFASPPTAPPAYTSVASSYWMWPTTCYGYSAPLKPEFERRLTHEISLLSAAADSYVSKMRPVCDFLLREVEARAKLLFPSIVASMITPRNRFDSGEGRHVRLHGHRPGC